MEMVNRTTKTTLLILGIAFAAAGTTAYVSHNNSNAEIRVAEENAKAKRWEAEAAYWNSEAKKWQSLGDKAKANEALALAEMRNCGAQVIQKRIFQ